MYWGNSEPPFLTLQYKILRCTTEIPCPLRYKASYHELHKRNGIPCSVPPVSRLEAEVTLLDPAEMKTETVFSQ